MIILLLCQHKLNGYSGKLFVVPKLVGSDVHSSIYYPLLLANLFVVLSYMFPKL